MSECLFRQEIKMQSSPRSINILGRNQRLSSKDKSNCSLQPIAHTYCKTFIFPHSEFSPVMQSALGILILWVLERLWERQWCSEPWNHISATPETYRPTFSERFSETFHVSTTWYFFPSRNDQFLRQTFIVYYVILFTALKSDLIFFSSLDFI